MKYSQLLTAIVRVHEHTQRGAAVAVNRFLVLRNWVIGAQVIEFEQNGEDRAAYGAQLLERISADLNERGLRGLGLSMLKNCRQLYWAYPWVMQKNPEASENSETAVAAVHKWNVRKRRTLKKEHILAAWQRLRGQCWNQSFATA